jgi:hypothetical protein
LVPGLVLKIIQFQFENSDPVLIGLLRTGTGTNSSNPPNWVPAGFFLIGASECFFFCGEFSPFCYLKKSQATWSRELFGKFSQKNPPYFKEESCEMAKIFGAFGQISIFHLLKSPYLANRSYFIRFGEILLWLIATFQAT